jgi:hypothetical protein
MCTKEFIGPISVICPPVTNVSDVSDLKQKFATIENTEEAAQQM